MSGERLLVPVSETTTLRQTVEYAVSAALEDGPGTVRFVFAHSPEPASDDIPASEAAREMASADEILDRVEIWADEDAGTDEEQLTVETGHIGLDEYLFSPEDVARALATEVRREDIGTLVLDPEYNPNVGAPLLRPLEHELRELGVDYETAGVTRQVRRGPLLTRSSRLRFATIFGVSLAFYMILAADPSYWFEWATGLVTATVVAVSMSQITLNNDPDSNSVLRLLRHIPYIPYLLWEILKANVAVTAAILDPRADIDPRLTRIRPAVYGSLPTSVLANSITLTPGTLTVRVRGDGLIVHTLLPSVRDDLFEGSLERAVRFVFYGRKAMAIATPRERGDTENLQPAETDEEDER